MDLLIRALGIFICFLTLSPVGIWGVGRYIDDTCVEAIPYPRMVLTDPFVPNADSHPKDDLFAAIKSMYATHGGKVVHEESPPGQPDARIFSVTAKDFSHNPLQIFHKVSIGDLAVPPTFPVTSLPWDESTVDAQEMSRTHLEHPYGIEEEPMGFSDLAQQGFSGLSLQLRESIEREDSRLRGQYDAIIARIVDSSLSPKVQRESSPLLVASPSESQESEAGASNISPPHNLPNTPQILRFASIISPTLSAPDQEGKVRAQMQFYAIQDGTRWGWRETNHCTGLGKLDRFLSSIERKSLLDEPDRIAILKHQSDSGLHWISMFFGDPRRKGSSETEPEDNLSYRQSLQDRRDHFLGPVMKARIDPFKEEMARQKAAAVRAAAQAFETGWDEDEGEGEGEGDGEGDGGESPECRTGNEPPPLVGGSASRFRVSLQSDKMDDPSTADSLQLEGVHLEDRQPYHFDEIMYARFALVKEQQQQEKITATQRTAKALEEKWDREEEEENLEAGADDPQATPPPTLSTTANLLIPFARKTSTTGEECPSTELTPSLDDSVKYSPSSELLSSSAYDPSEWDASSIDSDDPSTLEPTSTSEIPSTSGSGSATQTITPTLNSVMVSAPSEEHVPEYEEVSKHNPELMDGCVPSEGNGDSVHSDRSSIPEPISTHEIPSTSGPGSATQTIEITLNSVVISTPSEEYIPEYEDVSKQNPELMYGLVGSLPLVPERLSAVLMDSGKAQDTETYPNSCTGAVSVQVEHQKEKYRGTGVLIGPRFVLTAAHIVRSLEHPDQVYKKIRFFPAAKDKSFPFGKIKVIDVLIPDEYSLENPTASDHDYAVLVLEKAIGYETGWLGLGVFKQESLKNAAITVIGYPGTTHPEKQNRTYKIPQSIDHSRSDPHTTPNQSGSSLVVSERTGNIQAVKEEIIYYNTETKRGTSGRAMVYDPSDGNKFLVGVTAGSTGIRITPNKYGKICQWIQQNTGTILPFRDLEEWANAFVSGANTSWGFDTLYECLKNQHPLDLGNSPLRAATFLQALPLLRGKLEISNFPPDLLENLFCLLPLAHLETFSLTRSQLGSQSLSQIKFPESLTALDLSHNEIGDTWLQETLLEALNGLPLRSLNLSHNLIGQKNEQDKGLTAVKALIEVVKNFLLETLHLENNFIGSEGLKILDRVNGWIDPSSQPYACPSYYIRPQKITTLGDAEASSLRSVHFAPTTVFEPGKKDYSRAKATPYRDEDEFALAPSDTNARGHVVAPPLVLGGARVVEGVTYRGALLSTTQPLSQTTRRSRRPRSSDANPRPSSSSSSVRSTATTGDRNTV